MSIPNFGAWRLGFDAIAWLAMQLEFIFLAQMAQGRSVPRHHHQALELVYYCEGKGTTWIDGREYRTERNSFAITPPGIKHDQTCSQRIAAVCVGLSGSPLDPLKGCWPDQTGLLGQACQRLLQENRTRRVGAELICEGLLREISGLALRQAALLPPQNSQQALVQKATDIIQVSGGNLSVRELARRLNVSPDHLRHIYARQGRQTPLQSLIARRLECAKDLLAQPELSIKEVAGQLGFVSAFYFSRLFKQHEGQTASQFRRALTITETDKS